MKTKEELALEFANRLVRQDQPCPRECKDPGLYYGFLAGYEVGLLRQEYDGLLTKIKDDMANMSVPHIKVTKTNAVDSAVLLDEVDGAMYVLKPEGWEKVD